MMTEVADRLAGWIHDVDLQPGATRIEVVSGAATALAKTSEKLAILDLVLLAHGISQGDAVASVSTALRSQDEASVVREADLLATITAAAGVAFALDSDNANAVTFGLAVRSAGFLGLKAAVPNLDMLARAGLARASERQRRRCKLSVSAPDLKAALGDWTELSEGEAVGADDLNAARQAVEKATRGAAGVAPRALPAVTARFEVLEEEIDTLWWVFGAYSELADKPFVSVPAPAAACVAGLELASHTAQQAPIQSARAILSRVLQTYAAESNELSTAIPTAAAEIESDVWHDSQSNGHRLLPVLTAVEEFRSLNGNKRVWKETVKVRWELDMTRSTPVLDLAEQVYREVLLARLPAE